METDAAVWQVKSFSELSTQQLYKILQARIDVFVVEQNCPYPETDGYDDKALHLWAEKNGEIAAYCRIFAAGIKYEVPSIGRVLTTEKFRGQNFGKGLIKIAVDIVETRFNTTQIQISAQDYLLKFYQEFGFQSTGNSYLEDDIPHTEMRRN
ncbi:GNAT family N-acetyltransferase [Chryseobacterium sp. H3056]|uniref:GNAT family N-acetyltransferase n=1 Tax=Kaistella daneshvariae TaxID=2487074 RepID=A0A3N0WT15_9FLAO|nr:GNAT family N-acetyltransferase [Kaistella daneshvariae]ROI07831.1 GNAT family N-acetyltransferase [Kaistella daneshvariae]